MRNVIAVVAAVFLGLLIAIAVRPLLVPSITPPPTPAVSLPTPPTVPPGGVPATRAPVPATPAPAPSPAAATPRATPRPTPVPTVSPRPAARPSPTSRRRAPAISGVLLIVQVALVPSREEAATLSAALRAAGFDPYVVETGEGLAVRLGAFRERAHALRLAGRARARGFAVTIIERR